MRVKTVGVRGRWLQHNPSILVSFGTFAVTTEVPLETSSLNNLIVSVHDVIWCKYDIGIEVVLKEEVMDLGWCRYPVSIDCTVCTKIAEWTYSASVPTGSRGSSD